MAPNRRQGTPARPPRGSEQQGPAATPHGTTRGGANERRRRVAGGASSAQRSPVDEESERMGFSLAAAFSNRSRQNHTLVAYGRRGYVSDLKRGTCIKMKAFKTWLNCARCRGRNKPREKIPCGASRVTGNARTGGARGANSQRTHGNSRTRIRTRATARIRTVWTHTCACPGHLTVAVNAP
jgi:hypothetical protein